MTPQYPPIGVESFGQAAPVQVICACTQQMGDVSPVKTFSLHDVSLLPYQFFRRNNLYFQIKDRGITGVLEPSIIHLSQSVPRAENDVDIDPPGLNFRQPMSKRVDSCVASFS